MLICIQLCLSQTARAEKMFDQHHKSVTTHNYLARSANLPIGLCILPSVISSFFYYEQSHLSIYWTNFHDLYTKWKVFA